MPVEREWSVVGLASATSSPWVPLNVHDDNFAVTFGVGLVTGADPDRTDKFGVQVTQKNILREASVADTDIFWADGGGFTHAAPAAATTAIPFIDNLVVPVRGIRVLVSSVGTGTTLTFRVTQAGI